MPATELRPASYGYGNWYISQAAEEAVQVHTGKGLAFSLYVSNSNAADRWIWIFDSTTSSGTVLCGPFKAPGKSAASVDIRYGREYATGFRVAASSTQDVFTATGTADFRINAGHMNLQRRDAQ